MSLRDPSVVSFEKKMKEIFDRIDHELEERYGDRWPLHPARPARGAGNNPEYNGLFSLGASFSAGYGSAHGRGYVMDIRLMTLADVPSDARNEIRRYVVDRCTKLIPEYFPDRELSVVRDGDVFKIIGDLSLDKQG